MNNAYHRISLQFMTGFCIFGGEMVCLEIVFKTSYIFFALACESVAQW